ncbi:ubiquitin carboxyl-terminal hydrolase 40-like [Diadema antillarum]|uniref:ubiquitin carboxyl-terminal hydrolase 40-like n=1 Tax=Diadema antillarum TaxID=105358 RepID=UPI003A85E9A9
MFGDLFGEEDDLASHGVPSSAQGSTSSTGLHEPPSRRGSTGLAGIANQGATCYLNSLLQTLLLTPEFRESLFSLRQDELGSLEDKDREGSKVRIIPLNLQRLFAHLLLLDQKSASTAELTDSFGWTNNEELQQHDVQELNRILFCAVEESLVGTSGEHLISRLYRGTVVNQITCEECKRVSEREEDFLDLTLAVGGYVGVQDTLRANYVEEETMEGSNQYRCDSCRKLVNARKGAKIRSLPPVLTLSLLRFSYDFVKLERYKETGHYTFPMELDMSAYCEHGGREAIYELYSVVLHSGSTHGGHYHAYIRDVDDLGKWSEPESELIRLTPDPGSGKEDLLDMKSPQQCLTALLRKHGGKDHTLAVDKLGQVLNEETGVSWNKRFKRQYGTFIKFLKKHNDIFELNVAGTVVHLVDPMKGKASNPSPRQPSSPVSCEEQKRDPICDGDTGTEVSKVKDRDVQDQSNKEQAIARATASVPRPGHCWFDFNDSTVKPIREGALAMQFQGRESAYMLLYRRKALPRPPAANCTPDYKMPAWLKDEVEAANQEMEKKRAEYEKLVNQVEVTILLEANYTLARGCLHKKPSATEEPLKLVLDRRKSITHLMELILEQVPESPDKCHNCLHIAKELPAGIHLYDCVTDDPKKTLQEQNVTDGRILFLWDGKEVDGKKPLTGAHCEPILIVLTAPSSTSSRNHSLDDRGVSELSLGVAKDTKISEFRCMVSEMVDIAPGNLILSRVRADGPVVLTEENGGRTMTQMNFVDGDRVVAESGRKGGKLGEESLACQEADKQAGSLRLTAENRCVDPNNEGDWPTTVIDFSKAKTIAELKQAIIIKFHLYGNHRPKDGCRLRISDNALGLLPPLHENQSLEDAGIKRGNIIVIETGLPPESNELTLKFNVLGDPQSWDVMLDKNTTGNECLQRMLHIAGIEDSAFHLRKTNWCGEATGVISDMDQTLSELNLQDGDHVMLEAGRLPPKGFLLLSVWLHPPPEKSEAATSQMGGAMSWITEQFTKILYSLTSSADANSQDKQERPLIDAQSALLGQIEISQDASVDDLKNQVLTLPTMKDASVPTNDFLRLRLLEEGRMGRVLRDSRQSLRVAKVMSSEIAVQILAEEEQLRPAQLVLTVKQRISQDRQYMPPEELIWDAEKSAAPSGLRQAIADHMLLPVERIVVAKHLHKKYEWLLIPEDRQVTQAGRGRGRGGKKGGGQNAKPINLKQAPYNVRDGDVFGVLDLEHDPLRKDNFTTQEDDEGKQMMEQLEEEKRTRRRDRRNAVSMGEANSKERRKRQEVGLSIRVGNFR